MRKSAAKNGVGQLVLQIVFPEGEASHAVGETEDNGPQASSAPLAIGSSTQRKRKWYSLYDKVFALQNLWDAWIKVRANGGAAGIDRMSIQRFDDDPVRRLEQLCADLRNKTYRPQPVRRVFIPKAGGGQRPLGIPTVRDRIVQQALLQVLEPIFEVKFSNRSHGFRPERGCQSALDVVDRAVKAKYEWVVDADIEAFFDTVDHAKLVAALNEEIADGSVLDLISRMLKAGVVHPSVGDVEPTELGTPQGGPLSPLLANVYLHHFDEQMAAAGYGLVRYAADFVIFAKSERAARIALGLASEVLEGSLGLTLHPEKTRVVSVAEGFEFLGFHYIRDPKTDRVAKEVRRKSVQRFRETIRARPPRLKTQRRVKARKVTLFRLRKNERVQEVIASVNVHLRGWHAYFRTVWSRYPETPFRDFDSFVRRRIRQAITGRVGNGWWNSRLPNQALKELGLVCLDDLQRRYASGPHTASARKG
jgi:RNA-directed DNA polymerase